MSKSIVAALQIGSDYRGKAATLDNILAFEDRIIAARASLVVMPEALLGGYPKGEMFGTRLGYRLPEGRAAFARYYDNAIDMDAARIKGIKSEVAGRAQILVVPDLEAGNMLAKNLSFMAKADSAGIVLGARVPIILTSRADSLRARMASCAVAVLYADARRKSAARLAA